MENGLRHWVPGAFIAAALIGLPACFDDSNAPQLVKPEVHGGQVATDDEFRLRMVAVRGNATVVELEIGSEGPLRERSMGWTVFTVDNSDTAVPLARLVESTDARDPEDAKAFVLADNPGVVFDSAAVATSSPIALLRWQHDLLPDGVAILCHGIADTVAASGPCIAYPDPEE